MRIALAPGRLLALMVALSTLSYIDRQLLGAFVVDVRRDLGLSYLQFSLLAGLIFNLSYAAAGIPAGLLADRVDRPRLIAGAVALWSVLTAATGAATSFAQLTVTRAMVGVGEAALAPASVSLLTDSFPPRCHGLAISLFYLGIPLGGGSSLIIAGTLGGWIGWRGCFMVLGALGLLGTLALLAIRDPGRASSDTAAVQPGGGVGAWQALREDPALRNLLAGGVLLLFALGTTVLDQAWLVAERGYSVQRAQLVFGLMFLGTGVIGASLGGWLSDRVARRSASGRIRYLTAAALLFAVASLIFRLAPTASPLFFVGAAISYTLLIAPIGPLVSCAAELAPPQAKATMVAVMVVTVGIFGTAAGNAASGWGADMLIASQVSQPMSLALLVVNLFALPAALLFLRAAGAKRRPGTAHAL